MIELTKAEETAKAKFTFPSFKELEKIGKREPGRFITTLLWDLTHKHKKSTRSAARIIASVYGYYPYWDNINHLLTLAKRMKSQSSRPPEHGKGISDMIDVK